ALAEKYRDPGTYERAATMAWTRAQVQLHHLGIERDEADLFQHLANRILYSEPTLRPSPEVLGRNAAGPAALWAHRVSGDLPIGLVRIDEPEDAGIVRQLLRAHEYWRLKGLAVDLVILNEKATSYPQDLQSLLEALVRTSQSAVRHEDATRGNVFILRGDIVSARDHDLLRTAARAVLLSRHGTLRDQVMRAERPASAPLPPPRRARRPSLNVPGPRLDLEFFNGLGGFADGGREYVIVLGEGQWTPAPWINVVANHDFGFQVSESGAGYTWSINSRENQLTPWSNDPVGDPPGETLYIRDEESGTLWGPTPLPSSSPRSTMTRAPSWRATHGTSTSLIAWRSPTSEDARRHGPPTARKCSAGTEPRTIPPPSSGATAFPEGSGPASTRARRCKRPSSCRPREAPRSCSCSARPPPTRRSEEHT